MSKLLNQVGLRIFLRPFLFKIFCLIDSAYTEYFLPLDYVRNSDIEQYLRKHGAITYQEFSERKKLEQLEEEKKNQEKQRQKELEWKREQIKKEEYIRQRIAEVEA